MARPSHDVAMLQCVDRTIGSRLTFGFLVDEAALQNRLPAPWAATAVSRATERNGHHRADDVRTHEFYRACRQLRLPRGFHRSLAEGFRDRLCRPRAQSATCRTRHSASRREDVCAASAVTVTPLRPGSAPLLMQE